MDVVSDVKQGSDYNTYHTYNIETNFQEAMSRESWSGNRIVKNVHGVAVDLLWPTIKVCLN